MPIVNTLNISLKSSGAAGGPVITQVPTHQNSTSLDIRWTGDVAAGFTPLVSTSGAPILGAACLGSTATPARGILIFAESGTTASNVAWNTAANGTPVGALPAPVLITGGLTLANVGLCLSAATRLTVVVY